MQAAAFNSEGVQHASAASLIKASVGVVVGLELARALGSGGCAGQACLGYFDNSNDTICTCMHREAHTHHQSFGWPGCTCMQCMQCFVG